MDQLPDELEFEESQTVLARKAVKEAENMLKRKTKNLNEKLKLQAATEALEEEKEKEKEKVKKSTKKKINFVIENKI